MAIIIISMTYGKKNITRTGCTAKWEGLWSGEQYPTTALASFNF